jgi:hypothetical protein
MLRPISRTNSPPCRGRAGVTLLQLLVVLVVLLLLLGLLITAIQKVREAANRLASSNNLKQMMIGVHSLHDAYGVLPPSAGKLAGAGADATLFFHLLPYIEQGAVYQNKITNVAIPTYQARADPTNAPGAPLTSYASNFSVFGDGSQRMTLAKITKGTSNTVALMERYAVVGGKDKHAWGDTTAGATYLEGVKSSLETGGPDDVKNTTAHCLSPAGCQVGFCDGAVRLVRPDIKLAVFQWACDPTTDKPAPGAF